MKRFGHGGPWGSGMARRPMSSGTPGRWLVPLVALALVGFGACSPNRSATPSRATPSSVTLSQPPSARSSPDASSEAFAITGSEAAAIVIIARFIEAINTGNVPAAGALLTNDVVASDCDFVKSTVVLFDGKAESMRWIAERIADHERLEIGRIFNDNVRFEPVVGVDFSRRSNDTLARMGATAGIPFGTAKIVLTEDIRQIRGVGFGPGGADPGVILAICGPKP
jgi:hypothetical protein